MLTAFTNAATAVPGRARLRPVLLAAALALSVAPMIASCAGTRTQESTGEYVDDAAITTKVKTKLVEDQALKAFDIHVHTFRNVVQLSGFVDSPVRVARAVEIARSVEGVRSVQND